MESWQQSENKEIQDINVGQKGCAFDDNSG